MPSSSQRRVGGVRSPVNWIVGLANTAEAIQDAIEVFPKVGVQRREASNREQVVLDVGLKHPNSERQEFEANPLVRQTNFEAGRIVKGICDGSKFGRRSGRKVSVTDDSHRSYLSRERRTRTPMAQVSATWLHGARTGNGRTAFWKAGSAAASADADRGSATRPTARGAPHPASWAAT